METLGAGARGTFVEMLQTALKRAGYLTGPPDGVFGERTYGAAVNFQAANGLVADGIVGPLTWAALRPFLTGYLTWRVRSGDTLFALAARYGSSVNAITVANPGVNPANLTIGSPLVIPLGFEVVPDDISFTSSLLSLCAEGLAARYPFIGLSSIGRSVLGRDIRALKIGGGTREVMYNASHHANEWITTPVLMRFLERYAAAYAGYNRDKRYCEADKKEGKQP